ncbi:hypothetical protein ACTA71_008783 [Dictyostelium dimigraforme]
MGHIVNPNIYRLGYMTPWVSSGFKRNKKERSNIANEDFLIYNFTRNFFYKRVYKKVVGKIKKIQLKVKNRRRARKSKKKRKFGQTSLLNHWIIKYSHLTITRFNKTFQLNLFFFDRELQKRYRIRYKRHRKKKKGILKLTSRLYLKNLSRKKLIKIKKALARKKVKPNGKYKHIRLTTPVYFNNSQVQNEVPTVEGLSKNLAVDVSNILKQSRLEPINYSLARDIRKKGQKQERIYIYKDNTFETNKVRNRLAISHKDMTNETYKQLYEKKLSQKIFTLRFKKNRKYVPNFKFPKMYHYIDSFYFRNKARYANNYFFAKGNPQQRYNYKKKYLDTIRKNQTLGVVLKEKNVNVENILDMFIDRYENKIESEKYKKGRKKLERGEVIKRLKQNDLWKKYYLQLKIKRRAIKKGRKRRRRKNKHKNPQRYAKIIEQKKLKK